MSCVRLSEPRCKAGMPGKFEFDSPAVGLCMGTGTQQAGWKAKKGQGASRLRQLGVLLNGVRITQSWKSLGFLNHLLHHGTLAPHGPPCGQESS